MKKHLAILMAVLFSVIAVFLVLNAGCSKPEISGTYEGTLPCADCPGLQTVITLNTDSSFDMEETYLESGTETRITEGTWTLSGDIITFVSGDYQFEYKVISDKEIRWAPNGEEITGTDLNWSLFKKS